MDGAVASTHSDLLPQLQSSAELLRQGRPAQAADVLRGVVLRWPSSPDARRLFGLALRDLGDLAGAESQLGSALQLDPSSGPTAVALNEILIATRRPQDALSVTTGLASRADADIHLLTAHAEALKAMGRMPEALAVFERAAVASSSSAVAHHNLASILGDMEHFGEAETAARRAQAKGLDAPETWLVLGRALLGQRRFEEAEAAYRHAIGRRPDYADAHAGLAQLIWMRTVDTSRALEALDRALLAFPANADLAVRKSELLDYAGEPERAYECIARFVQSPDGDPTVHVVAARLMGRSNPERAVWHAGIAARALLGDYVAQSALCEAWLAVGDAGQAVALAERLQARMPDNQHAAALLATAWRLAGDPRYRELYDYDSLIWSGDLETPKGWSNLDGFLADLARSLAGLHAFNTHPVGQSLRHGSQTTQSLTLSKDPVVQAFFEAVDRPIRERLDSLGQGPGLVARRNTGGYEFNGVWSVRLQPNGFHADHVHPMGWLSSACHIALPSAVDRGREGWLKFGEPGIATRPALQPEHFVKPSPGRLVLFPSYMWHGTVPFSGDEPRLTIAFDLTPARA
jgi:tetratricopeptide (TPR) repeat protein